jgi:hypothetical protein
LRVLVAYWALIVFGASAGNVGATVDTLRPTAHSLSRLATRARCRASLLGQDQRHNPVRPNAPQWEPDLVTDPNSYKARLEAKLQPARVRATLAFAGLFQLTHEMLKSMVLDDVKSVYGYIGVGDGTWLPESGEHEYRRKVLDLVRASRSVRRFYGCRTWTPSPPSRPPGSKISTFTGTTSSTSSPGT